MFILLSDIYSIMTNEKKFIVVYTSSDGQIFHRAVIYDDGSLNAALIEKDKPMVASGGTAFQMASDTVRLINSRKNNYTGTVLQFDDYNKIPETLLGPQLQQYREGHISGSVSESYISPYQKPASVETPIPDSNVGSGSYKKSGSIDSGSSNNNNYVTSQHSHQITVRSDSPIYIEV
jgi:hypothetical protein